MPGQAFFGNSNRGKSPVALFAGFNAPIADRVVGFNGHSNFGVPIAQQVGTRNGFSGAVIGHSFGAPIDRCAYSATDASGRQLCFETEAQYDQYIAARDQSGSGEPGFFQNVEGGLSSFLKGLTGVFNNSPTVGPTYPSGGVPRAPESGIPSWVLPVGLLAGGAVVVALVLRKA